MCQATTEAAYNKNDFLKFGSCSLGWGLSYVEINSFMSKGSTKEAYFSVGFSPLSLNIHTMVTCISLSSNMMGLATLLLISTTF